MRKSRKFWDRFANRYARSPIKDEAAYQEKLRIIREHLHADARVLEFGSGTGSTAIVLAADAGAYQAIDYSAKMIDIAQGKLAECPIPQLDFTCSDFESLVADAASYDLVLGMNIVHLLPDWHGALDKAAHLLKPGGVFISSTACVRDMNGVLMRILPLLALLGLVPTLSKFTQEEYRGALLASGFHIIKEWQPGGKAAVFIVAEKV